ncbi:uncharacterized protein A1O5_12809 [Cladophialophora psammophila CBS 110553]|uniref:VOC domain-containing protein n=1 Tax=Cladophialophora psammophila CBS 110553 TaxID=1182543 RepID=W9VPY5_9EURO|nr:uncharacterized protein A1O5_12809 [Cladophialophora psammophila CBS 110553]EXJ55070.1 hypothetical protein A1O5_12809 [Cladophialophora psammophila CBS 110553]
MAPSAIHEPATSNPAKTLIHHSPRALAHVVLRTRPENYETMIRFYQDLLGAKLVHKDPVLAFLRYDEEHHRIALISSPETQPKSKSSAGLDHIAFSYSTLTQLAQQYVYLKSMENPIKPLWSVNHGPTTSLYYRDPDGNKIELQVDNFDVPEDADAFMSGPLYDTNPMGTDFDADKWADDILSKTLPDGSEGLSTQEIKEKKMRKEIGERLELPDGFF